MRIEIQVEHADGTVYYFGGTSEGDDPFAALEQAKTRMHEFYDPEPETGETT